MIQQIGLIAAVDLDGTIGYNGSLPWHNKTDLARFKKLTADSVLIMGRKTYESLPEKKLPGRIKHVLSRWPAIHQDAHQSASEDTKWFYSMDAAVLAAPENKQIWIAGGEEIYKLALNFSMPDFIDLTILNMYWMPPVSDNLEKAAALTSKFPNVPFYYKVECEYQSFDDSTLYHRRYILRNPESSWLAGMRKNLNSDS